MISNKTWLMKTADAPIRFNLNRHADDEELLLQNNEVMNWLSHLAERANADNIGDVHGSHDYRMENILGKCWILGLSKSVKPFTENMAFITRFLSRHVETRPPEGLSFGKIYYYRDFEKILGCYLPLLGFRDDASVLNITRKRINVLYEFTRQRRYDIYVDGSKLKGVKKEWQPYIINSDLYADGNIALPDMHDFLMFAGMYDVLTPDEMCKVEVIAQWLFGEGYSTIIHRYGYFYIPGGTYNTKAVIFKPYLLDFQNMTFDSGDLASLLFNMFILSYFQSARDSLWFSLALSYLEQYKKQDNHYQFSQHMIVEKPDNYVISGGHMNVGENKKSKLYREIISTYWAERIYQNLAPCKEESRS